jgi:hypothetical protein
MSTGDGRDIPFQCVGSPIWKDKGEKLETHRHMGHSEIETPFTTPASEGTPSGADSPLESYTVNHLNFASPLLCDFYDIPSKH